MYTWGIRFEGQRPRGRREGIVHKLHCVLVRKQMVECVKLIDGIAQQV